MGLNPWAGLIVLFAILLIIVAWKGTQDNVIAALLNRPYQNSTLTTQANATSATTGVTPAQLQLTN